MNSNSFVGKLMSFNFEVFGVVQGVFFRKYTEDQAKKLGIIFILSFFYNLFYKK